jgi:hypothetical protein
MDDDKDLHYGPTDAVKDFFGRYWPAISLAALASLVIIAYAYRFAPGSNGSLATDTEEWARFGEYVGGFFGVFAFVGVLITMEVQRQQLRQLKDQATIDELYRICRDLASSIDEALDGPLILDNPTTAMSDYRARPTTMRGVLERAAAASKGGMDQLLMPGILVNEFGPLIQHNAAIVGPELDQLADCLQDALDRGGSGAIFKFYHAKYREIVLRMRVMECAPTSSLIFWMAGKS